MIRLHSLLVAATAASGLLGLASAACNRTAQPTAAGGSPGTIADALAAGGEAPSADARGGGSPDASGGAPTADGATPSRNCAPDGPDCKYGPRCGTTCCGSGEWCDTRASTPECRCGAHSACTDGDACYTNLQQPNQCGDICCSGSRCPISRRSRKRDIHQLTPSELNVLRDELRAVRLSTYRYREAPASSPRRLGFIIDETVAPYAIEPSGNRVDLYGYASMLTAAIQLQAAELEALEERIDTLAKTCGKVPSERLRTASSPHSGGPFEAREGDR